MKYSGLSARERTLLEEIETRNLVTFTPLEAAMILGLSRDAAYRALSRLEDKDAVIRIERGKYILERLYQELDIYEIAPHIIEPSYISLWSGLHYYGLTTQVPTTVFLLVTRARKSLKFQKRSIRYVKVKRNIFFGYRAAGKVVIAEPEKLILDCLAFPHYAGGFKEILEAAKAATLDTEKIVDYAIQFGSGSVTSRLGFLLETIGKDFDSKRLLSHISKAPVTLDPSASGSPFTKATKWNLKINVEV